MKAICQRVKSATLFVDGEKISEINKGFLVYVGFSVNDTEENILAIVDMAAKAGCRGIIAFGIGMTLRDGNRQYFYSALDRHFDGLSRAYCERYGNSYEINSPKEKRLWQVFTDSCRKAGLEYNRDRLFTYLNEFPESEQLSLF